MNGVVFTETLRRGWRGMIYWGLGFGFYGLMIMLVVQDSNLLKQYGEISKALPPALLQLFGGDATSLATPEGFLAYGFFGYLLLIFAVYAILSGLNITANDEDAGIMDMVLSLPLPRWRVVLEKFLAYSLMILGIVAISYVGLLIGTRFSALQIDGSRLFQATVNIIPATLLMLGFTALVGAVFRSKGTATAVAAFFVVGSYVLNFLGVAASGTFFDKVKALSFFSYYDHQGVILHGLSIGNVVILLVVTVICAGAAVWSFQRRDVGI
ncbi:MAG: ABC transporter permease subunit [Anaerolineaceae bacterium]|nr:ABC transporter permease subunit [Anaerolineaceae bacterium]